jgi:hypothetical protein
VNVVLLDEARRQFETQDTWWRENRTIPDLFVEEFEQALSHLAGCPEMGQRYRWCRGRLIRRWLLKKTGCHIYYFYDRDRDVLEIHSVWGARRARGPKL